MGEHLYEPNEASGAGVAVSAARDVSKPFQNTHFDGKVHKARRTPRRDTRNTRCHALASRRVCTELRDAAGRALPVRLLWDDSSARRQAQPRKLRPASDHGCLRPGGWCNSACEERGGFGSGCSESSRRSAAGVEQGKQQCCRGERVAGLHFFLRLLQRRGCQLPPN